MAATYFGLNDPAAVKHWRKRLGRETIAATYIGKFIGESDDSLIQEYPETGKGAGDKVTVTLRGQLTGDGVLGDGTLEGNEEALGFFNDNLIVDQLRHAERSAGKMSEQRVPWNLRVEAGSALRDWWARRFDTAFFNQISGFTPAIDVRYTGNQAVAPASTVIRPNARTSDEALTSADTFTLGMIDAAVSKAKARVDANDVEVPMRPIMVNGEERWVMFIHSDQEYALKTEAGAGKWRDIMQSAMTGDGSKKNPLFTGALGVYNGVVLHSAQRTTRGVNSTTGAVVPNTRRAVLCGAQAAAIGFGEGYSFNKFDWVEKKFDYDNQLGVAAGMIYGLKKTRYNNTDFSTVVVSTYAAPAA